MNFTYKNLDATQKIITSYYCKWSSGAKEYFNTVEEALQKAEQMYVKKQGMSDDNFTYWLSQKQYIGMETTIETPIKVIFSPIYVGDK